MSVNILKGRKFLSFYFCVSNCVLMLNISLIHLAKQPEEEKTENWRKIEVFNLEEQEANFLLPFSAYHNQPRCEMCTI